ncbi:uncharacterized protein [Epargyreus clarus]|uniref:uncharacterized protein n=1 Tax=Epargyreus clarus TaxID=520877 RepID=UPI003C30BE21
MAAFTLLGVVLIAISPCSGDQSGESDVNGQPMGMLRTKPEVVLQLKYEQGQLNRIYLTQFRKETRVPSVPASTELCADLCHAGLGGESCGITCTDMIPVGLASALRSDNQTTMQYGEPRTHVCPTLCKNRLGNPLCNCPVDASKDELTVNWEEVCAAFCSNDGFVLGGCPPCKEPGLSVPVQVASLRVVNTSEGWVSWCNVQCRQGHGGAACNCDRAPFQ